MKVLHVIPSVSPSTGGPAHAVVGMCRALQAEGAYVTIATTTAFLSEQVPTGTLCERDGLPIIYFPCEIRPHLALSIGLRRWLRDHIGEFDVVHVHAVFTYPSTIACRMAERNAVPYLVRPLGGLSRYSLARHRLRKRLYLAAFERHNLEHAAALHFTSAAEAEEAAGLHLAARSNVLHSAARSIVLPLGVDAPEPVAADDLEQFRSRNGLGGKLGLLFLGRLDPKKGLELLFEALASAVKRLPPWRLLIAGSGAPAYTSSLRVAVERAGLADQVAFLGELHGREKWTAFRAADLFVLPSHHENFAVAAAEALSCGLPVIVSSAVGIAPYVTERKCGIVVENDASSLAAGLIEMAMHSERRPEMGESGRALAAEVFNWRSLAERLMEIYAEIGMAKVQKCERAKGRK